MVFVINKLKYDTDKMLLISEKCEHYYTGCLGYPFAAIDVQIWKSKKGNWLLTFRRDTAHPISGIALTESEAMDLLLKYDLEVYETLFGELEEA